MVRQSQQKTCPPSMAPVAAFFLPVAAHGGTTVAVSSKLVPVAASFACSIPSCHHRSGRSKPVCRLQLFLLPVPTHHGTTIVDVAKAVAGCSFFWSVPADDAADSSTRARRFQRCLVLAAKNGRRRLTVAVLQDSGSLDVGRRRGGER